MRPQKRPHDPAGNHETSDFLWKNERGIYFFRARVPKRLSEYFTGLEIKRSLKTDSYRLAVRLTTALLDRITHHCEILETGNDSYRFKQRKKAVENQ